MNDLVRILYVDDYAFDRELVRDALKQEHNGFHIIEAASRQEFEARLAEGGYDVVLSDFNILGFEGLDVIEAVRTKDPRVPVVIVTGTGSEEVAVEAMKRGAADYVIKTPAHIRRLPHTIRTVLETKRLKDERQQAQEESRQRAVQQQALNAIIASVTTTSDLAELLQVALEHTLRAVRAEMGAIWAAGQHAIRGLPPEFGAISRQTAQSAGLDIVAPIAVEDWQQMTADDPMAAFEPLATQSGLRAILVVPVLLKGQRIGGLALASPEPRPWSGEEIALVEAVGRQLGAAAERLSLLERTRQQAQQMQQIIHSVPEGVLLLNTDLHVLVVNPAGQQYLDALTDTQQEKERQDDSGQALTHLGERPIAELLTSPPVGLWHEVTINAQVFEVIAQAIETGPANEGWVLVIRDVTQEREVQQRIQQQERLAAVGQLAAGIAHDFNNIMAVIVLYAAMMLRVANLPSQIHGRLEIISQQAKRATELIQQILDFSRRAVLERRPMDVGPFLKEQVKLLERTLPENIKIKLACGSGEYIISADPTRMQQAIMNLALNARDAMPRGGELQITLERVWIESRRESPLPEMAPGEWVQVTVADTGSGIPPNVLPHIFDPFFTTKEPGKGSGLGLAQVHGIVKQHEGEIDVSTQMGQGTSFILYLPVLPVVERKAPALERQDLPQGQGETLLVVEDNAVTRNALVDSLQLLNYQVLAAANGQEALDLCDKHSGEIALVLSDMVMPEMGGVALFQALRRKGINLPVVILTGHLMEEELENLRVQGLRGWLLKPPDLERLARLVARTLGTNPSSHREVK